ncbi:hypothetical protein PI125_g24992 [Phytophthora idaei]|nr:hypothetical protein PI125_g24992 [Phytophthora idaei]
MLVATLFLLYPGMLRFCDSSPFVVKMREAMVARSIGESEVLAWSSTIRREFIPASQPSTSPSDDSDRLGVVLKLVQRQTEQISVLILQNKQLEERLLAVEDKLHTPSGTTTQEDIGRDAAPSVNTELYSQPPPKAARAKRKGSQSLEAMWFEWFTAEPRVYASQSIKKKALYELRHVTGYLMLFLPTSFALDLSSPAFKSEVLVLGKQAQGNALAFLKKHGSSAVAAGTALKALRKIHKLGKLNDHIAQYHDRLDQGAVVDPTPSAALPAFIWVKPSQ